MISKNEYLYAKKKVEDYKGMMLMYEVKSDIYRKYQTWLSMLPDQQVSLITAWDQYYESCRNGYYGLMFYLAGEASNQKDLPMLRLLISQVAASKVEYLKAPSSIDPRDFIRDSGIMAYKEMQRLLVENQKKVGEYAPVYETKSKKDEAL